MKFACVVLLLTSLSTAQTQVPETQQPQTPPSATQDAAQPPAMPIRVHLNRGVTTKFLIQKVTLKYPADARAAHIQGIVVMNAIIGVDGSVQDLSLKSGHPMLAPSALDAVRQWKYKPFRTQGQRKPAEVETEIEVIFSLSPS